MAELRLQPPEPQRPTRRLAIPLWGLLLAGLLSLLVIAVYWPHEAARLGALVDPVHPPGEVLVLAGQHFQVPADAQHRQEIHPPDTMRLVGQASGYGLYAPRVGGGGGSSPRLYVRSGNDLFIPLVTPP